LQDAILRDEAIECIVGKLQAEIERYFQELDGEHARLRTRKAQLETENSRLVQAIIDGQAAPSVMSAIADRDRELKAITERLLEPKSGTIQQKVDQIRRFVVSHLTDLRQLLSKPAALEQARALLAQQFGKLTLMPSDANNQRTYLVKGAVNLYGDDALRVVGAEGRN
jgi:hypothetical protein